MRRFSIVLTLLSLILLGCGAGTSSSSAGTTESTSENIAPLLGLSGGAGANSVFNYLGPGTKPRLRLELSANGPGWQSYTIDYQQSGNIPYSTDPTRDWSAWNVKDEASNYYGTIVLHSDGRLSRWESYTSGDGPYYLDGVHFSSNGSAYQLTVDRIGMPTTTSPFPNAPLATPATRRDNSRIRLSVSGANIVDDRGRTVRLKGLVRPSLEWNNQGQMLSPEDIAKMRSWGANVIRIDMFQEYWFASGPRTEKGSYRQIIDAIIYYATQNEMAVILDLHLTQPGHQTEMPNAKSTTFWNQVAFDYRDFGTVIFELYNEPYGVSPQVWLNGGGDKVGMQSLFNTVRNSGANNICLVNGLDYGYDLSFVNDGLRVAGTNLIYGAHPYNGKLPAAGLPGATASGQHNFDYVLGKYPIFFTEFGTDQAQYYPQSGSTAYTAAYRAILTYVNANNIHYTGFAWWHDPNGNADDAFPSLISDWNGTPKNGGTLIKADLQTVPPTSLFAP